jgi:phosphoserine phosphatase RsbU/P
MNSNSTDQSGKKEPGLGQTIKEDFKRKDKFKTFHKDFRGIRDYYITSEKKKQLNSMFFLKRWFFIIWWTLKAMMLKLTPVRRIMFLAGLILILSSSATVDIEGRSYKNNHGLAGGILIVVVLMLELKDKLLAKEELKAGRRIQKSLMPEKNPEIGGWSVWMYSQPANEICGDLIDFVETEKGKFKLVIADVSGKGLDAALFTTKLQASLRTLIYDYESKELIKKVNSIFYREKLKSVFASLIYIEVLQDSGILKFVNAGHIPPVVIRSNGIDEFPKGNAALGLLPDVDYEETEQELQKGDFFIVYSDGVTEATNDSGNMFGKERFFSLLNRCKGVSVNELGEIILKEINEFMNESLSTDDLSLIIMKKE